MEADQLRRRVSVPFPAALLPALIFFAALLGTASGASGLALVQLLRAHARRVRQLSQRLSHKISRTLSGRLLTSAGEPRALGHRKLLGGSLALLLFEALRRFVVAVRGSLALMNPVEEELDAHLAEKQRAVATLPAWGHGLPRPPQPGEWRPYLYSSKDARENLEEIHGILGITGRRPEELTLDQLTEGVRRVLVYKYTPVLCATRRYWNREQARSIAEALAAECGLPEPLLHGGLEEVVPADLFCHMPWTAPRWLQLSQRLGIAALRPIFLHAWSWSSRYVQTPFGPIHVYDAQPHMRDQEAGPEEPPLLLQHGLFVTGWSMAPLGWLLARRGRRVVMPDLFDFDHGLSASESARSGGEKVRRTRHLMEALLCVARDLLEGGARELDICGHSFGGFLASAMAARCEREGLPLRKVVLLGPGGPFVFQGFSPTLVRFLNRPLETIDESVPWWLPAPMAKAVARCGLGVLLSPNNSNYMFGLPYSDVMGYADLGSEHPALLLWGDQDIIACPRRPCYLGPFLRASFPRLEAYWVRRGGHNIQLDSAVAVARAMDAWLRGCTEGSGGLAEKALFPLDTTLVPMDLSIQDRTWPHRWEAKRSKSSQSRL